MQINDVCCHDKLKIIAINNLYATSLSNSSIERLPLIEISLFENPKLIFDNCLTYDDLLQKVVIFTSLLHRQLTD